MNFNPVNMLEDASQSFIYNNIQGRLPTEQEIRDVVERFKNAFCASDEDAVKVIEILHARLTVSMDTGESINKKETYKPWLNSRKSDIDFFYWNRYAKYLEIDKKWSKGVVATIDHVTDKMLDLCGDPLANGPWQRRGLVLGDVQSGKTANYTALINKAADAGYRVVILLSGIIENLRRQTQERLDEGFVGRSSKAALQRNQETIRKGVGNIDSRNFAMAFTTESNDFKMNTLRSVNMSLLNTNQPVLFVVKKNSKSLENLITWLKTYNMDGANSTIDLPLLLIDDEADNASVNTKNCSDPTKINRLIRTLLTLFKKSSYVGVTATPFANIFIEPDTKEEMLGDDLFPRDYIYALSPPSNYIGSNAIFGDDAKYGDSLEVINDAESYFPFGHKTDLVVNNLPSSLKDALNYFVLVNAIRDLRGDRTAHRSMLINVSRLTAVQEKVKDLVIEWFHEVRRDIQHFYKLPEQKALKSGSIQTLKRVWDAYGLEKSKFTWADIQRNLHNAATPIEICSVNQRSSSANLDYEAHKENGLRIVAVGGHSLSRGLTLEGLCVSYFYRNTQMYDTLMQMGRWFGYRPGYEDLFRIWMPQDAIDWYAHITEASNELRAEIRRMNQLNMTPEDFGLKVRAHPNSLIVTARNKMRSAQTVELYINLDGEFFETPRLLSGAHVIRANHNATKNLIEKLFDLKQPDTTSNRPLWTNVSREIVVSFLKDYINHPQNVESNTDALTNYILQHQHLDNWDIVIPSGNGERLALGSLDLHALVRKMDKSGATLRVSGTKLRVGAAGMTKNGLSSVKIAEISKAFSEANDGRTAPDKAFLIQDRRPLLVLYHIQPKPISEEHNLELDTNEPLIAYGIGFPRSNAGTIGRYAKYVLNAVEQRNMFTIEEEDDEINDDI